MDLLPEDHVEERQKGTTVIIGSSGSGSGSGKGTLPKSVLGLSTIYSGDISFHQKNIAGLALHWIAKKNKKITGTP